MAERTRISVSEPSDEANKLHCPTCGRNAFHINMDGERAEAGGSVNNIECDSCHAMLTVYIDD
jgi:hypothetical protein